MLDYICACYEIVLSDLKGACNEIVLSDFEGGGGVYKNRADFTWLKVY